MQNEKVNQGAEVAQEAPKVSRRGLGSARGTQRMKFSHEHAMANGLFMAHLDSVTVSSILIGEDKTGLPSFNGMQIPRIALTFASNEAEANKRHYVTLSFTAVESNVDTIPGGSKEWTVNTIFDWFKHILDVYHLKGRELTQEEEEVLSLPFTDFDENGDYQAVDVEEVVAGWEETLDGLVALVDQLEVKIKEYTDQLFEQTKDYIENSEFGQYIKQLENAIGEQGWNGRLLGAEIDAKAVASANALKDLTAQYNALNDEIVEEFKNSIFGKFLSIIESQQAIDAFEAIGLTQVHEALKLLPEIATLITKYYPKEITSIEGALSFLSSLTPEVTGGLTAPEYELVEYVPAE